MRRIRVVLYFVAATALHLAPRASLAWEACECPTRPILLEFSGFNEGDRSGTDQLADRLAVRLGLETTEVVRFRQPIVPNLFDLVGDVLAFEEQPLDDTKSFLKSAVKSGWSAVRLAGAPVYAQAEYKRAKDYLVGRAGKLKSDPCRPVYILAYSWGTVTARLVLQKIPPEVVQGVALVDPVHVLHPKAPRGLLKLFIAESKKLVVDEDFEDKVAVWYQRADDVIRGTPVFGVVEENIYDITTSLRARHPTACPPETAWCLHTLLPNEQGEAGEPGVADAVLNHPLMAALPGAVGVVDVAGHWEGTWTGVDEFGGPDDGTLVFDLRQTNNAANTSASLDGELKWSTYPDVTYCLNQDGTPSCRIAGNDYPLPGCNPFDNVARPECLSLDCPAAVCVSNGQDVGDHELAEKSGPIRWS